MYYSQNTRIQNLTKVKAQKYYQHNELKLRSKSSHWAEQLPMCVYNFILLTLCKIFLLF